MQNIFFILVVLIFVSCSQPMDKKVEIDSKGTKIDQTNLLNKLEAEYKMIDTISYLEAYLEKVIIEGSSGLGFASGDMQGGFAHISDAKKISHFVVTLADKNCTDHEMASMYYTSNCGGCHGDDGKGQNGTFPDLTKPMLLGILKRKEFLEYEISRLKNSK